MEKIPEYKKGDVITLADGCAVAYASKLTGMFGQLSRGMSVQTEGFRGDVRYDYPIKVGTVLKCPCGCGKEVKTSELLGGTYVVTELDGYWPAWADQGSCGDTIRALRLVDGIPYKDSQISFIISSHLPAEVYPEVTGRMELAPA